VPDATPSTSAPDCTVDHYIDDTGQDCYRICLPGGGLCSIVSSAHLIEERKTQLIRAYCAPTATP
jgi:hypothetical protein